MPFSIDNTSFTRGLDLTPYASGHTVLGGKESDQAGVSHSNDPVRLSLSPDAERLMKRSADKSAAHEETKDKSNSVRQGKEQAKSGKGSKNERLSESEQKMVDELLKRDQEVRTHEAAHAAAAGSYAIGGPSFEFQQGPDGRSYAVGGHVKLDMKPESTPEATVTKMQTIRRAALAPADPSGADRSVAAAAAKMEMEARREMSSELSTGKTGAHDGTDKGGSIVKSITYKDGLYGRTDRQNHTGRIMDQTA